MEKRTVMTEDELRDLLNIAFEYSAVHEDWVNPVDQALEGVDVELALRRSDPEAKCIWEIILHMAVWNENIVERVATGEKARPPEGHWPALPSGQSPAQWESAKTRLYKSLDMLKDLINNESVEKIKASPWGFCDLICRPIHIAYHLGQITKMKEIYTA
ncbi:MAG: DinB family protein [Armatimonadota bacterium]